MSGRVRLLVLLVVAVLPYLVTLRAPYVFDDYPYLLENTDLRGGWSRVPDLLTSSFPARAPERGLYRPFTAITFLVDSEAGFRPWLSHTIQLVLAALTAAAVWGLARRFMEEAPAWLAGLVFAVHPVHVEVVAWVAARSELLATLFAVVALTLATDALRRGSALRGGLSAAVFLAAILSKENAAMAFPLLALLIGLARERIDRSGAFVVASSWSIVVVVALVLRHAALGGLSPTSAESVGATSWVARLPLMVAALGEHLRLLVWPYPLSIERMSDVPSSWSDSRVALGGLVVAGWIGGGVALWRVQRSWVKWLAWPPIALLPVSHIVPIGEAVAERFLFLPSIGVACVGGLGLARISQVSWRVGTSCALVGLFAVATGLRANVWTSEERLFRDAVEKAPTSGAAWASLGEAYRHRRDPYAAIDPYRKALGLEPGLTVARLALAACYDAIGQPEAALRETEEAVLRDPTHAVALNNLGARLSNGGQLERGREMYRRSVSAAPRYAAAWRNLAWAEVELGDRKAALEALERAVREDPTLPGLTALNRRLQEAPSVDGGGSR